MFDEASDVVVYDVEKHEIVTLPEKLFSRDAFETFDLFLGWKITLFLYL